MIYSIVLLGIIILLLMFLIICQRYYQQRKMKWVVNNFFATLEILQEHWDPNNPVIMAELKQLEKKINGYI